MTMHSTKITIFFFCYNLKCTSSTVYGSTAVNKYPFDVRYHSSTWPAPVDSMVGRLK